MQTFSSVRRNSTNKKNLNIFLVLASIVFYIALTDMFFWLPPLFGVGYVVAQEKYEAQEFNIFYFLVPLFIFFESSKNLPLFSSLLFMAFSFYIILPKIRKFFGSSKILIPLFIGYAYVGYFLFLNFFNWIFGHDLLEFKVMMVGYVLSEIILVWFFLWVLV